jgi:uncharacterized iron-regulated membrane protein
LRSSLSLIGISRIRNGFFWLHLVGGVVAGVVIVLMSVTGVLLTYERQLIAWSDRAYHSTPTTGVERMSIEALLARVQAQRPDAAPLTSVVIAARGDAPVTVTAGAKTYLVDVTSGRVLGESSPGVRRFMSRLRAWHRWFAVDGTGRPMARAITGWSNLIFLVIVASGIYLWMPRRWTWQNARAVLFFRRTTTGKARDFNWHNVVGIWSAVPLFIVVLCAVPISFPWANTFVYRVMGEQPPAAGREGGGGRQGGAPGSQAIGRGGRVGDDGARDGQNARDRRRENQPRRTALDGLNAGFARAQQQEPGWRTITLRAPNSPQAPLSFVIDRGDGGQPQLRATLTLVRADASVVSYETFATQSPARRLRSIMRFAHTGEVLGMPGQTVAGLASGGAVLLACTGVALAIRRLSAWRSRRRQQPSSQIATAA